MAPSSQSGKSRPISCSVAMRAWANPRAMRTSAGGLLGGMVYEGYGAGRCNCKFTNTYPLAIGPRLGVAYKINAKTVFRGGWGLVYGGTPNCGGATAPRLGPDSQS